MSPSIYDLGIDKLSPQEKFRLIGEIWDSLESTDQIQLSDQVQLSEAHWREIEDEPTELVEDVKVGASRQELIKYFKTKYSNDYFSETMVSFVMELKNSGVIIDHERYFVIREENHD